MDLLKSAGGLSGGGSTLTAYADEIMRRCYRLKQTIRLETDRLFEEDFKK
jgi:molybdenum-dependent DNA-binding transcriptional regulator ModE